MSGSVISRPLQKTFLHIPQSPLCYWLRPRFFELLAGRKLGDVARVATGLQTSNDPRFVRYNWEVPPPQHSMPLRIRRWVPFEKGGGYGKWFGHQWWGVDWEHNGARIKGTPGPRVQNERHYFRTGWTYSSLAGGCLGVRMLADSIWGAVLADAIFLNAEVVSIANLNGRIASGALRWLRAQMVVSANYVSYLPFPKAVPSMLRALESGSVGLKRVIVACDITERSFDLSAFPKATSGTYLHAIAALLHTIEGYVDQVSLSLYGLDEQDEMALAEETGSLAGSFPLLSGFELLPAVSLNGVRVPREASEHLRVRRRLAPSQQDLDTLRLHLRSVYEAGRGAYSEKTDGTGATVDDEDEVMPVGPRIPIPAETFLEELSQKLEIHPISVYWLLKEGIEKEGWRCLPQERRLACERVTVMILLLLGHQWPTQIEAGEAVPEWADRDGIIPVTEGTGEPTLIERLRRRIAEEWDRDQPGSFERHFAEIMEKPLERWIEIESFKYQTSLFRRRPIAWQIQSGKYTKKRKPAFACLVYYHRLDGDLIPKIRTQYVGPLRRKWETELRGIEEVPPRARSDRQDLRRVELQENISELKEFDVRLAEVAERGFDSGRLKELLAKESADKWCSIDGQAAPPADWQALLAQEARYLPDVNDGVRVNIAPLQKAGLLAADVLAGKDVEAAIADRAEWRSDERRWCREGKLPQPGWWKEAGADGAR